jgi:phosphatidylcholine synthase
LSSPPNSSAPRSRRLAAWGVHAYTAIGLPIAFLATAALYRGDHKLFFLMLCAAVFVDATDGTLARAVRVKEVLPDFDGRRLDDLVDFLIFAFLPALALPVLGMIPEGLELAAVVPLLASGYGFCQDRAKTEESFVGFPSYWNVVVLYLYLLRADVWMNLALIMVLSVLVFVPIHYVYPTKTRMLRRVTVGFGYLWAGTMTVLTLNLDAAWTQQVAVWSLIYPAYYFAISGVNHVRIVRVEREEEAAEAG